MMKQLFAFESMDDYKRFEPDISLLIEKLHNYEQILRAQFELNELPKTIVWTTAENVTTVFSKLPVPAFTNGETIYISPSTKDWQSFYINMLEDKKLKNSPYYEQLKLYFEKTALEDVFCIVAHELTHHIDLFPDEFGTERHNSIWFEEGMCEYLSQRLTLTDAQYFEQKEMERLLINELKAFYGNFSLDEFGSSSYNAISLACIMLNYWRSSAAIHEIVENRFKGDIIAVFTEYLHWHNDGRNVPLTNLFNVENF